MITSIHNFSVAAILEYMDIWEFVSDVVLQPEVYCGGLLSLANILQSQLTRHFSLVLLSTCL
jgi:hypothetical protein